VQRYGVGPDVRLPGRAVELDVSPSRRPGRASRSSCTSSVRSTPPSSLGVWSSSMPRDVHRVARPRSAREERSWSFRPARAWKAEAHELVVRTRCSRTSPGTPSPGCSDRDLGDRAHRACAQWTACGACSSRRSRRCVGQDQLRADHLRSQAL
jgi:hypothetical protein